MISRRETSSRARVALARCCYTRAKGLPVRGIGYALITAAAVCALSCGKRTSTTSGPTDMTTAFDATRAWAKQACMDVIKEKSDNPIRGDELQKKKLEELRAAILNKPVRWRLQVLNIIPPDSLHLGGSTAIRATGGAMRFTDYLNVRFSPGDEATVIGGLSEDRIKKNQQG